MIQHRLWLLSILAYGEEHLEIGILLLQLDHPFVGAHFVILRLVSGVEGREFVRFHPSETGQTIECGQLGKGQHGQLTCK